jgi:hypothetical protein
MANSGKEIQNSYGKGQMEKHLKFGSASQDPLPFDLLVCL